MWSMLQTKRFVGISHLARPWGCGGALRCHHDSERFKQKRTQKGMMGMMVQPEANPNRMYPNMGMKKNDSWTPGLLASLLLHHPVLAPSRCRPNPPSTLPFRCKWHCARPSPFPEFARKTLVFKTGQVEINVHSWTSKLKIEPIYAITIKMFIFFWKVSIIFATGSRPPTP